MSSSIQSLLQNGMDGIVVEAECQLSNGLPAIIIVGLGNRAIEEAKERVRSALAVCKLKLPAKRITVNLAPADVPKDSTSLDLAIAVAILQASGQTRCPVGTRDAIIGELGLDGKIRPVRGIIGKLLTGKAHDIDTFYIPKANLQQAALVPNINIIPLDNLRDLYLLLAEPRRPDAQHTGQGIVPPANVSFHAQRMDDIVGQEAAKRALEIAAAGGHNVLLSGPPGSGKSMLAKALPGILPPLTQQEMLEVTHLHSLASNNYDRLVTTRPFRNPHHSASSVSIVGGGHNLRPGEISLSHRGVLMLDEIPEFDRNKIEALRQPLEDGIVTISRAKDCAVYPAEFILVATANPCPCGYYGSERPCTCSAASVTRYQQKLSGPILDRFDLFVTVAALDHSRLLQDTSQSKQRNDIRKRVSAARTIQRQRFDNDQQTNGRMTNRDLKTHAQLTAEAKNLLNDAATVLGISARSYMRTVKVARTIADLEESRMVGVGHITEALQYRRPQTVME